MENKSIYELLQEARYELSQTKLNKSGYNAFAKFNYFELGDFLPKTIELLKNKGLTTIFSIDFDSNGVEYAILKVVRGSTGETIDFRVPTAECTQNNPIQGLGSKITYLRRYLFVLCMDIIENDVVDAVEPTKEKVAFITKGQKELIMKHGKLIANELSELGIKKQNDLSKLSLEKASELCKLITERHKEEVEPSGE